MSNAHTEGRGRGSPSGEPCLDSTPPRAALPWRPRAPPDPLRCVGLESPAIALLPGGNGIDDAPIDGIDDRLVSAVDGPPGVCVAVTRGVERTLLTTGGANRHLGRWLTERSTDVVERLGRAPMHAR